MELPWDTSQDEQKDNGLCKIKIRKAFYLDWVENPISHKYMDILGRHAIGIRIQERPGCRSGYRWHLISRWLGLASVSVGSRPSMFWLGGRLWWTSCMTQVNAWIFFLGLLPRGHSPGTLPGWCAWHEPCDAKPQFYLEKIRTSHHEYKATVYPWESCSEIVVGGIPFLTPNPTCS